MKIDFKAIAEEILGRTISSDEGIEVSKIETKEKKMGITLPDSLKEFYSILGNNILFVDGFQHFATIEELFIKDDKLVFQSENQSVMYWAIDLNNDFAIVETTNQDFDKPVEWFDVGFKLDEFLTMMLFYQCVMANDEYHKKSKSGYEYAASLDSEEYKSNKAAKNFIDNLNLSWEEITKKQDIAIYWNNEINKESIIMLFFDEEKEINMITACTKSEFFLDKLIDEYGFGQL
jgi:hypothetical protein